MCEDFILVGKQFEESKRRIRRVGRSRLLRPQIMLPMERCNLCEKTETDDAMSCTSESPRIRVYSKYYLANTSLLV